MDESPHRWVGLRAAVLWWTATAALAAVGLVTVPTIAAGRDLLGPAVAFPDLLVAGCSAALLVATTCLWALTTDVALGVLRGDGRVVVRRPGRVRLLLLAGCGAVALAAPTVPATADDGEPVAPTSLAGLPLPDRPTGDGPPPDRPDHPERADHADHPHGDVRSVVRVRPGDSLWAIAEERLGPGAASAEVAGYWRRIYDRNADLIGPDPGLILPGQLLELPPTG